MSEEDIRNRQKGGWRGQFSVGPGWIPIVVELDQKIAEKYPDYGVHQVKEKFGGLRYYCDYSGDEEIRALIREAERKASETCEECGQPGVHRTDTYWYRTMCDNCNAKYLARREAQRESDADDDDDE